MEEKESEEERATCIVEEADIITKTMNTRQENRKRGITSGGKDNMDHNLSSATDRRDESGKSPLLTNL